MPGRRGLDALSGRGPLGGGLLAIAPAVRSALRRGRPVVALETTLMTHGLPHPDGLAAAAELEEVVASTGAVPATIGVVGGRVVVGLDREERRRLAVRTGVIKLNPGNLGAVLAGGGWGSTTVAATLLVAHRAGIRVFATGGIGGVHREVLDTDDVSADLAALSRHPVAVVCAGAKAILDLGRTVERLETLGVPVIGLGTDHFPAFYRRASVHPVDHRVDSVHGLAAAVGAHFALGAGTGVVVANPIPQADELPAGVYDTALEAALRECREEGRRGRDVTPWLLERLRERTGGATVTANRALLRNNARVAGELAVALG